MSGWDLGVYAAGAVLIIAPLGVFICYLREMARRLRENDWGQAPPVRGGASGNSVNGAAGCAADPKLHER